tara:strand:- start:7468 stop:8736 length:1269 start_codon:yes stop_codon:yes gene_type:complete
VSQSSEQNDFTDIDLLDIFGNKSSDDYYDVNLSARRVAVLSLIEPAAEATGVNADTLRGMWWVESRSGHPEMLISPTGAKGDWQFTKETQANVFLHHGPDIADNLEKSGFMAEAQNVRMFTRGFRNLAIEKYGIETAGLALDESESNDLFRGKSLSWGGDIVPARNSFFKNPRSFENFDNGQLQTGYNILALDENSNILERMDRTRLDLPATMTFTAAYYIKEIAEDANIDASNYNNAGALYAGYNIGPDNAARLQGALADSSNAMGAIGFAAEQNPYFFRGNATGTEALGNYQSAVDEWRNFRLYDLEPSQNLVEGVARGLRENTTNPDINPYDVYSNVMEDRGYYDRAENIQATRNSPFLYASTTSGINIPFNVSSDLLYNYSFDPVPHIDPDDFTLSRDEKALLLLHEETDPDFLPVPK